MEESFTEEELRKAQAEISTHVSQAHAELEAATKLADKYKLSFNFDVAYGMGGTYYGDPEERSRYNKEDGWQASSASC